MTRISFEHRGRHFGVCLDGDGTLALSVGGVVRKRCPAAGREPQYVWTNVELEWEEHHYVEARYWASDARLAVTINRQPVLETTLTPP